MTTHSPYLCTQTCGSPDAAAEEEVEQEPHERRQHQEEDDATGTPRELTLEAFLMIHEQHRPNQVRQSPFGAVLLQPDPLDDSERAEDQDDPDDPDRRPAH